MSHHPFSDEQLIAFALGELDASESDDIARHVAGCAQCRALIASFENIRAALRPDGSAAVPRATLVHAQSIFRQHATVSQAGWWTALRQRSLQPTGRIAVASVLATILLVLVLLYGSAQVVASAVQETLPGDTLYPVKTTMEDVGAAVALDDRSKVQIQLAIAQARVTEINALVDHQRYNLLPATTQDYQEHVQKATATLGQVLKQDPQQVPLAQKAEQDLTRYQDSLSQLQENSPRDIMPQIQEAVNASTAAKTTVQHQLSDIANPSSATPAPLLSPTPTVLFSGSSTPTPSVLPSTPAPAPIIVTTPSGAVNTVVPSTGSPAATLIVPVTPTTPVSTPTSTNTTVPASPTALATGITITPSMTATLTATIQPTATVQPTTAQPTTTTPSPTTPAASSTPTSTSTLGSTPTPSATATIPTPTATLWTPTPIPHSPTPSTGTSGAPTTPATPTKTPSNTILSGAQSTTPTTVPSPTSVPPRPTATSTAAATAIISRSSTTASTAVTQAAATPTPVRATPTLAANKPAPATATISSGVGPTNTSPTGIPNTSSEPMAPFGSLVSEDGSALTHAGSRSMISDSDEERRPPAERTKSNAEEPAPRVLNRNDRRIDNDRDIDRDVPRTDSSLLPPIVFGSISFFASLGIIIRTR